MPRVAVYDDFESLPESCAALFRGGVFQSLPWFRVLVDALGKAELRIHALESDGGEVHALIPMVRQPGGRLFNMRRLAAAANYYTPLFSPLVADGNSATVCLDALAREIAQGVSRSDMVSMYPMDRDAPMYASTLSALRAAGMAVQPYLCFGNWYLKVNGRSYDDYVKTLPPRLRNTMKRKGNQLENRLRIEIISGGSALGEAIAAYETIYRASWKQPEGHPEFMPRLIRTCADEGWLRMGVAWIDGEPAAAQVWMVDDGVASIFKLAYDQRFVKHSVGSLLTAALMRHVIDIDRVQEVDFLSGDDAYKQDWMSHRRERWGIAAFNLRTMRGLSLAAVHFGRSALKHAVKRLIPFRRPQPASA
jgi:CelD/BcsL family acetyltransferase involved in cellulose biosynthesis